MALLIAAGQAGAAGRVLDGGFGVDRIGGTNAADDRLDGGSGNDRITSVDTSRDTIDCGPGRDTAIVDRRDRVRGCERVLRSGR